MINKFPGCKVVGGAKSGPVLVTFGTFYPVNQGSWVQMSWHFYQKYASIVSTTDLRMVLIALSLRPQDFFKEQFWHISPPNP